jgi:predicted cupin superfamily sugar epimerase
MHARPKLTAADVIRLLDLKPHPEGGHFRETIRDERAGTRAHSTGIYFLLAAGERSHWHKVDAMEVWHYYAGATLTLEISPTAQGPIERIKLGPDLAAGERPQAAVPAHAWQAAESFGRACILTLEVILPLAKLGEDGGGVGARHADCFRD